MQAYCLSPTLNLALCRSTLCVDLHPSAKPSSPQRYEASFFTSSALAITDDGAHKTDILSAWRHSQGSQFLRSSWTRWSFSSYLIYQIWIFHCCVFALYTNMHKVTPYTHGRTETSLTLGTSSGAPRPGHRRACKDCEGPQRNEGRFLDGRTILMPRCL